MSTETTQSDLILSPRIGLALSIRQPWAWLILNAGKDVENRTWPTRFRGKVLIHAAKGMTLEEWEIAHEFYASFNDLGAQQMPRFTDPRLSRGGIVGEVEIVDCIPARFAQSDWAEGPFCFLLRNPRPLPFTPCRGALGFWSCGPKAVEVMP